VSACLVGVNCRYEGDSRIVEAIRQLDVDGNAIPVCPEQLGGLTTPRIPAEIVDGDGDGVIDGVYRVVAADGTDVTAQYLRGAREVVGIAGLAGATAVILKQRSPSCGCGQLWRSGKVVDGNGVAAALLAREGFEVISDEEYATRAEDT